jgi:formylglycine-generating enzyme required for sulfatase activity
MKILAKFNIALVAAIGAMLLAPAHSNAGAVPDGMALVAGGVYKPDFRADSDPAAIVVDEFYLDILPVTNGDFLEFVNANPRWQRSKVKRIFADENYLKHWKSDLDLGDETIKSQPVRFISWFAAKAYASWKGKRLPTTAEWELAAAASQTAADASNDKKFKAQIADWYAKPTPKILPNVGAKEPNFFGIHDLHGLVWEWVSDFNTAMVTGDNRGDSGLDRQLFCGAGAQNARDRENYPAFMRFGFRSSLKADYTVHNLGFRCAKTAAETNRIALAQGQRKPTP